ERHPGRAQPRQHDPARARAGGAPAALPGGHAALQMTHRMLLGALAVLALGACAPKSTLERSRVEIVRVEGRRYEVRVASTDAEGEWRMLVVRATIVLNPDPERERARNFNVAQQIMQRTCRGPFQVLENNLVDSVNLHLRFRCT